MTADTPWISFGLRAERFVESLPEATPEAALDAATEILGTRSPQGELAYLVRRELPADQQVTRCIEIAVAHGSGGWPAPLRGDVDAAGVAFSWIAESVEHETRDVMAWLERNVAGDISWPDEPREFAKLSADEMTWRLIAGECQCLTLAARDDHRANANNDRAMADRHNRDHYLASWQPSRETLWEFLANAVRGRGGMRAGSIRQGMFYPQIADDLRLRYGNVPLNYCIGCHGLFPHHEQECRACGANGGHLGTPAVLRRRFVIDGGRVAGGAVLHKQKWWRCSACDGARRVTEGRLDSHAFPDMGPAGANDECPLCGEAARGTGKKRADVYTRVNFDDLM